MENKIDRRGFLKGAGTVALAAAATTLLGGCTDETYSVSVVGLNKTAVLSDIRMTVRKVYAVWDMINKSYYVMPQVVIRNDGAMSISVEPVDGNFALVRDGVELTCDKAAQNTITESTTKVAPLMMPVTLNHGNQTSGFICGRGSTKLNGGPLSVIFYPNPNVTTTYLVCRIPEQDIEML